MDAGVLIKKMIYLAVT